MGNKQNKRVKFEMGLRLLKIKNESPACQTDLEVFMDYIVSYVENNCNEENIDEKEFKKMVMKNINREVKMIVYNIRRDEYRNVSVFPNKEWKNSDSLLGCMLRMERIDDGLKNTYKVEGDREEIKKGDYILGMVNHRYSNLEELNHILNQIKYPNLVEICLFNIFTNQISYVCLLPSQSPPLYYQQNQFNLIFSHSLSKIQPPPYSPSNNNQNLVIPQSTKTFQFISNNNTITYQFHQTLILQPNIISFPNYYNDSTSQSSILPQQQQQSEQQLQQISNLSQQQLQSQQQDQLQQQLLQQQNKIQITHIFFSQQKQQEYQINESDLFQLGNINSI